MKMFCSVSVTVLLLSCAAATGTAVSQTPQAAQPAVSDSSRPVSTGQAGYSDKEWKPGDPEPPPAHWGKPASTPNDTLVSPQVSLDGRVTFRLYAPEAKTVTIRVNSDFKTAPLHFVKDSQGIWTATTDPVPSGAYRYNFMVDGATVLDSRNPSTSPGATNVQSLVEVSRSPDDIQANRAGVTHGTISEIYYDSPVTGGQRRLHIYLPPKYDKGKNYPVLYLIHGGGDDDQAWPTVGRANFILDNLIAAGKAKPMVIVFPDASINGNLQQVPSMEKDPFISELLTVIIPYIEAHYRVSKLPQDRAIAGLSMGGHQALYIGLTDSRQFHYLGDFSSGLPDQKAFEEKFGPTLRQEAARLKLIWFGYGVRDPARPNSRSVQKMLDGYGIKYKSEETPGGHDWANWRLYLSKFAPLLFR